MPLLLINGLLNFLFRLFGLLGVPGTDRAEERDYVLFFFSENSVKYFRLHMVLLAEEIFYFLELFLLIPLQLLSKLYFLPVIASQVSQDFLR